MMLTFSGAVFISKQLKGFLELWINWQARGIWKWELVLVQSCPAGTSRGQVSLFWSLRAPVLLSFKMEELHRCCPSCLPELERGALLADSSWRNENGRLESIQALPSAMRYIVLSSPPFSDEAVVGAFI